MPTELLYLRDAELRSFDAVVMAIVAWLTVITGTWIVYPWYQARPPDGALRLRSIL